MRAITRTSLALLLLFTSLSGRARPVICPPANTLISSQKEIGVLSNSLWKLGKSQFRTTRLEGSIMVFSSEEKVDEVFEVEGYIWWAVEGTINACAKFKGEFHQQDNEILLRLEKVSSEVVPRLTRLKGTMLEGGEAFEGKMEGYDRNQPVRTFNLPPQGPTADPTGLRGRLQRGSWKAIKIFPVMPKPAEQEQ